MPNMTLSIEQRLGQRLTTEQLLLWNYLITRWPNLTFKPFVSQATAAAPLTTYNANTIYVAHELYYGSDAGIQNSPVAISLYDEANTKKMGYANVAAVWNTPGAIPQYITNGISLTNIWFSRLGTGPVSMYLSIVGYVITI